MTSAWALSMLLLAGAPSAASPVQTDSDASASIFARAPNDATHAAARDVPKFPFGQQASERTPSRWLFALLGLGVVGAGLWAWSRQPRTQQAGGARIDVLAVRSLGPRHQLTMIEAGGERLLLCTSSKGVTLLSHLGGRPLAEDVGSAQDDEDDGEGTRFSNALVAADARGLQALAKQGEGRGRNL